MPENPTVEGPEKSLRQAAPRGDVIAAVFGLIAAYILVSLLVNRPDNPLGWLVGIVLVVGFGVPAYVIWASSRQTGLFVTDARVEYRVLGQPRYGWNRDQVKFIEAQGGGLKVVGTDGQVLRQLKFRWWNTEQVSRFARAAGLAPPTAAEIAAATDGG